MVSSAKSISRAARRGSILVVDDDLTFLEVFTLALSADYEIRNATTGADAVRIAHDESLAAVVLDYRLPDRSGLDVLREIRVGQPDLPVIMITGYGSEVLCASAFKLGAIDYIPKPLNVFALRELVCQVAGAPPGPDRKATGDREGELWSWQCRPEIAIQRAAVVIQLRYWDRVTLPSLAREVGMSKYQLSRRFREVMGITLRRYLLSVRLERAKDLLAASPAFVTEVAQSVGFSDLARFDKVFKRYTGVTPSSYRARIRSLGPIATDDKNHTRNY